MLELMALTVVWLINWCGLLLYLGTSKGASESLRYEHVVSVIIVASIAAYIVGATEFLYKDYCRKNRNKFINRVHSRIKSGRSIKGGDAAAAGAEGAKDPDDNNAETSVVKIRPANVLPPRGNQNAKYGSKNLENRTGGKASTTKNKSPGADGGSAGDGPLSSRPVMPEKFTSMPQDWRGQRRKSRKKKKHDDFESKVRNSFHARKRASHIRVAKKIHSEHLAHDRLLREKQKVEQEKAHDKVMARVEARKKLSSCLAPFSTFSRRRRFGFWVAMPTGQLLVWQARIPIHPIAWRAELDTATASAPRARALMKSAGNRSPPVITRVTSLR